MAPRRRAAVESARAKRALDLAIALPALIILLPLLILICVAIRLDSRGPVIFRQRRIGLNGEPFDILKLRTMRVLENGEDFVQARKDDPRVTRVGALLRSSSLDEIPQLINVVRGDMSLVGPRPHACAHEVVFEKHVPNYALRRQVKPGITGWAQIHGLRGPTPTTEIMRERIAFDLWYARHCRLALDLKILARTPREVLRRRNAL